jgi:segregation and condensation protein B
MLYGTTRRFLEVFGLENLKNLPTLRELDELAREQGLLDRTSEDAPFVESSSEEPDVVDGDDPSGSDEDSLER